MKDRIITILGKYTAVDNSFETSTEFTELDGWDSLKHVQFILDVENELNVKLSAKQLVNCKSVDLLLENVKS